ncbi:hypothetical protein BDV06DRAFT_228350 [Aspergillus oleicola]
MSVHVVSKSNYGDHATFPLTDPSTPPPSSIRIHPSLLSLTSNNLTYTFAGTRLHWWDADGALEKLVKSIKGSLDLQGVKVIVLAIRN